MRFTYDINGILQVEVTVAATGARHELILEQSPGALSKAEIAERLAALASLKVHPRDKQENLALIARAERLYEEYLGARDWLAEMIAEFHRTLAAQDERHIEIARRSFGDAMDRLENS